jgi:hypothetical protein
MNSPLVILTPRVNKDMSDGTAEMLLIMARESGIPKEVVDRARLLEDFNSNINAYDNPEQMFGLMKCSWT